MRSIPRGRQILPIVCVAVGILFGDAPSRAAGTGGRLLIDEDFASGMADWWVEGAQRVWIEDGRLHVKADPPPNEPGNVATVWHKQRLPANVRIDFDAHVVESSIDANNINFFFCYGHPSGKRLYETRVQRADAAYSKYHQLNGYIVTFLNDVDKSEADRPAGASKARFRLRRCPGFNLVDQTHDYHCRRGVTYHVTITKRAGELTCAVDGKVYLKWADPEPLEGGLIGLRTYRTYLWWDNIRVREISGAGP